MARSEVDIGPTVYLDIAINSAIIDHSLREVTLWQEDTVYFQVGPAKNVNAELLTWPNQKDRPMRC